MSRSKAIRTVFFMISSCGAFSICSILSNNHTRRRFPGKPEIITVSVRASEGFDITVEHDWYHSTILHTPFDD
jgi:hypothetical protein